MSTETVRFDLGRTSGEAALKVVPSRLQPTTATERLMLLLIPAVLPLQASDFSYAGFSFMYLLFALLAVYVSVRYRRAVNRAWLQPTFLAAYVFLILVSIIEFAHSNSDYYEIYQTALMIAGAVVVASLCRDRKAFRASIYGHVIAGAWVSIIVFASNYGVLSGASAMGFDDAGRIRSAIYVPEGWNLNAVAGVTAAGATTALALGLSSKSTRRRNILFGVALFCAVSTFLPMSRGGVMMLVLSSAGVLRAYGLNVRSIMMGLVFFAGIVTLAPEVVFSRLTYSTEVHEGRMEARAQVYTAALEQFPNYAITGVGVGNFWDSWGFFHGFAMNRNSVVGAHNALFQTTIYWGLGGLLGVLAVIMQAYRCLPKRQYVGDEVAICAGAIAVLAFLLLLVGHGLFIKQYSVVLGLLAGVRCWIHPSATTK